MGLDLLMTGLLKYHLEIAWRGILSTTVVFEVFDVNYKQQSDAFPFINIGVTPPPPPPAQNTHTQTHPTAVDLDHLAKVKFFVLLKSQF